MTLQKVGHPCSNAPKVSSAMGVRGAMAAVPRCDGCDAGKQILRCDTSSYSTPLLLSFVGVRVARIRAIRLTEKFVDVY